VVGLFSSADLFQPIIWTDGELSAEYLSLEMIALIDSYGPWGQHFPQPQFHGDFAVSQQKILNQRHIKWELTCSESSEPLEALLFFAPKVLLDQSPAKVKIVYKLSLNQFAGRKKKQLLVQYAEVE
jgi:single-stranded-DNA-specific exonuclease